MLAAALAVAIVLVPAVYIGHQKQFAVEARARVLRALTKVDNDATAARMREQLTDEIGEDYRIQTLVSYPHILSGYAYVDGVAVTDGRRYSFRYFFMRKKIQYWGAVQQEPVAPPPPTNP
ncbi:MAG: hypothetical protein WD716_09025 [Fimbriimonadaceae bacterium]